MTKVLIGDREKDKKTYRFKLVGLFLIAERGLGTPENMGKPRFSVACKFLDIIVMCR